jgi:hypothetical protein
MTSSTLFDLSTMERLMKVLRHVFATSSEQSGIFFSPTTTSAAIGAGIATTPRAPSWENIRDISDVVNVPNVPNFARSGRNSNH